MAGPVSISTNQVNTLQPPPSADQQLKDIQDHVGSRAVSGKVASWVRNNIGKSTENAHTAAFRAALTDKVGSKEAADSIMSDLGLGKDNTRSLTSRKVADGIAMADTYLQDIATETADKNSKIKDAVKKSLSGLPNDAENTQIKQTNDRRAALQDTRFNRFQKTLNDPNKSEKEKLHALPLKFPVLNRSGVALYQATLKRVEGNLKPPDAERLVNSLINQLGLKDNEVVTDKHIDKLNDLASRYESYSRSELGTTSGPVGGVLDFSTAWEVIHKGGSYGDPKLSNMKDDEIVSIVLYTGPLYKEINDASRKGTVDMSGSKEGTVMEKANQGLDRLPNFTGTVYRNSGYPKDADDSLHPGLIFKDKTFFSTAANPEGAQTFKNCHALTIQSKTGKDISFLSVLPKEQEILFKPNTSFLTLEREGALKFKPDGSPETHVPSIFLKMVEN